MINDHFIRDILQLDADRLTFRHGDTSDLMALDG